MIITIDTSALLAVLLNEEHKPAIIKITKGHDLQAPKSLDAEVGNALSAMFKRGPISREEALEVVDQFKEIPIRRTKLRLQKSLIIAEEYSIYAYDAYVLDCARQYRSPLLSLDNKLMEVANDLEIRLLEVSS